MVVFSISLFCFCDDYLVKYFGLWEKVFSFALVIWKTDLKLSIATLHNGHFISEDHSKGFMGMWVCRKRNYSLESLKIWDNQFFYNSNMHLDYLHICMQYYLQVYTKCYFYTFFVKKHWQLLLKSLHFHYKISTPSLQETLQIIKCWKINIPVTIKIQLYLSFWCIISHIFFPLDSTFYLVMLMFYIHMLLHKTL